MIEYRIGKYRYWFDEEKRKGAVLDNASVIMSGDNPVILYNRFISEIDCKLREHLRGKLEAAGINQWTGKPERKAK